MPTTREQVSSLLDAVPDDRLDDVAAFLRDLAIPDDDETYTEGDLAAIEETRAAHERGELIPHDEAMRSIGL